MIDKNDVKMPVQKENISALLNDADKMQKMEELLDMVNSASNRQELRLKQDYYGRFNWFGLRNTTGENTQKSYFSYQEEAVYDFVFNLNKSGILSDQVGMGKTIEAGMIISELASRNELRSLLIIVPNEIMAQKWDDELKHKFGIDQYTKKERIDDGFGNIREVEYEYPVVKAIKSFDDFCRCIFDCMMEEMFPDVFDAFQRHEYKHEYNAKGGDETLADVVRSFIKEDLESVIESLNMGFENNDMNVQIQFNGETFALKNTKFKRAYTYDEGGLIKDYIKKNAFRRISLDRIINGAFNRTYEKMLKQELECLFTLIGQYFTTLPEQISAFSANMINRYPILVIPISYSEYVKDKVTTHEFLNRVLLPEVKDYRHCYIAQTAEGEIREEYESYRIIDFFIDVAYQTVIVDEVHDYIDICAKMERAAYHKNNGYNQYPSSEYNRYELFDDYYFIKKSSLYKKLKALADKANRKIFLTATPIKSDMVDFYLLTLLASNKDSETYKKMGEMLQMAFPMREELEKAIFDLYFVFKDSLEVVSKHFTQHSNVYLESEVKSGASNNNTYDGDRFKHRFKYPYFNNSFLLSHYHRNEDIKDYLNGEISYLSMEEIVMELILAYIAEETDEYKKEQDIDGIMQNLCELLDNPEGDFLQTRVVFRSLFNNSIKIRFEEDFTNASGVPIKRIRELLETEDGPRKWHKTYRKYGIRHTRHQTYNLGGCAEIEKLSENRRERYKNLPIWPKRDGKVIFLVRDDIFFDCFQNVKRDHKTQVREGLKIEELPNFDKLTGSDEQKQERFENAMAIFDYINGAMSGGDPVRHEPASSKYYSIHIDDQEMVDYKLALVSRLMSGGDSNLGTVSRNVLLFAENDRAKIVEWFGYIRYKYLLDKTEGYTSDEKNELATYEETLDKKQIQEYEVKWKRYGVNDRIVAERWIISENAGVLDSAISDNLLIIIDPKRYEKGVDLQKADTIINFDINYCPLKMEQRIGRIDRIRPAGQSQQINIVSFVPLNDMSGYVINFFANELKMFTQWMGETTGIVSVPEEASDGKNRGEGVSFEDKVYLLEKYYQNVYTLCKQDVSEKEIKKMAEDFRMFFGEDVVNEAETFIDFKCINKLRPIFDDAFKNSISPKHEGYEVYEKEGARVLRFNSVRSSNSAICYAEECAKCRHFADCQGQKGDVKNNIYSTFVKSVKEFFAEGERFYQGEHQKLIRGEILVSGGNEAELERSLVGCMQSFKKDGETAIALLPVGNGNDPFTMPFGKYTQIFDKMKKLFWDDLVEKYIRLIIEKFHKQCDSVLEGASLFEHFIKTLSVASFMNNMEGNNNDNE